MSYFQGHHCPAMNEYLGVNGDIKFIQRVLGPWLDGQKRNRRHRRARDRLAYELEELEERVEESLSDRKNERSSPDPEEMSLEEKILNFLDWRNELQILHSSIGR
jgi:hypothetical protein